jgi:hypothetical protein
LITKNAKLLAPITAQSMGTEQSRPVFVDGADGLSLRYRRPDQAVDILHRLNSRLNDSHRTLYDTAPDRNSFRLNCL